MDELHTSWSVTGAWADVSTRAALGNQLPLYFGGLWFLSATFGASELLLRSPSLVAWVITVSISAAVLFGFGRQRSITLWPLVVLLALDRGQIFFATEARPYALLSLVILLAWLALDRLREALACSTASLNRCLVWLCVLTTLDGLAFWIQPTAVLHVAVQFVCLIGLIMWHGPRRTFWMVPISGGALLMIIWPARSVLLPAWQHRQLWASFASDISLPGILRLMPLAWWLLPVSVACVIQFLLRRFKPHSKAMLGNIDVQLWLWLCAGIVPLLIVITLTAFQIAPLAYPRYLVAAVPPLMIACGLMLSHIGWSFGRAMVMCIMLSTLLLSQRDVQNWFDSARQGRWPRVVRGEDWRGASQWIVEHSGSGPGSRPIDIFCASMLIEGSQPTNDPMLREYLALPLKSMYMPTVESRITPLFNAPSSWRPVIQTSVQQRPGIPRWIVARLSARAFQLSMEASGLEMDGDPISFGGVTVVRLSEPQRAANQSISLHRSGRY